MADLDRRLACADDEVEGLLRGISGMHEICSMSQTSQTSQMSQMSESAEVAHPAGRAAADRFARERQGLARLYLRHLQQELDRARGIRTQLLHERQQCLQVAQERKRALRMLEKHFERQLVQWTDKLLRHDEREHDALWLMHGNRSQA
ncbi:hypothetical protein [Lacisediminimonas profundi]|uniref:hypothetical protein n=1 Tax=Lacisediminimonas profundi TaxID=2603856 RepID=UPI00124B188A|nr:hypothetical protein [Lacisediminimonas profundi]